MFTYPDARHFYADTGAGLRITASCLATNVNARLIDEHGIAFFDRTMTEAFLTWGVGPVFALPTATDPRLGVRTSAGPSFVAVVLAAGFLINNLWSFAGDEDRPNVNAMTLQPFFNYNLPEGWYLTTSPIITANWEADSK